MFKVKLVLRIIKLKMGKRYFGIWSILFVALALFVALSVYGPIKVGGIELRAAGFYEELTKTPPHIEKQLAEQKKKAEEAKKAAAKKQYDLSKPQTILFVGDSMLEGLYPRLASYAKENGHKVYSVIWYSSTSEIWGEVDSLKVNIERYKPSYVFICLGANELFVKDIAAKRDKFVKNILSQIGDLPYLWIGPPNWKPDTGINDLIAKNAQKGCFFLSNGMTFDRKRDGAHPTHKSSIVWMDSVVRWMAKSSAYPIANMKIPTEPTARAERVIVYQPKR